MRNSPWAPSCPLLYCPANRPLSASTVHFGHLVAVHTPRLPPRQATPLSSSRAALSHRPLSDLNLLRAQAASRQPTPVQLGQAGARTSSTDADDSLLVVESVNRITAAPGTAATCGRDSTNGNDDDDDDSLLVLSPNRLPSYEEASVSPAQYTRASSDDDDLLQIDDATAINDGARPSSSLASGPQAPTHTHIHTTTQCVLPLRLGWSNVTAASGCCVFTGRFVLCNVTAASGCCFFTGRCVLCYRSSLGLLCLYGRFALC